MKKMVSDLLSGVLQNSELLPWEKDVAIIWVPIIVANMK